VVAQKPQGDVSSHSGQSYASVPQNEPCKRFVAAAGSRFLFGRRDYTLLLVLIKKIGEYPELIFYLRGKILKKKFTPIR
jgi:hypothetical protein